MEEEHKPRGPEGPFQFQYDSVPAMLVKSSQGETLADQFGCPADAAAVNGIINGMIQSSLKKNGPVVAPKDLLAIQADLDAVNKALAARDFSKTGKALLLLQKKTKTHESLADEDAPAVVRAAREAALRYQSEAQQLLTAATTAAADGDWVDADAIYRDIEEQFESLPAVTAQAQEQRARLFVAAPRETAPACKKIAEALNLARFGAAWKLAGDLAAKAEAAESDKADAAHLSELIAAGARRAMDDATAAFAADPGGAFRKGEKLLAVFKGVPAIDAFAGTVKAWGEDAAVLAAAGAWTELQKHRKAVEKAMIKGTLAQDGAALAAQLETLTAAQPATLAGKAALRDLGRLKLRMAE